MILMTYLVPMTTKNVHVQSINAQCHKTIIYHSSNYKQLIQIMSTFYISVLFLLFGGKYTCMSMSVSTCKLLSSEQTVSSSCSFKAILLTKLRPGKGHIRLSGRSHDGVLFVQQVSNFEVILGNGPFQLHPACFILKQTYQLMTPFITLNAILFQPNMCQPQITCYNSSTFLEPTSTVATSNSHEI